MTQELFREDAYAARCEAAVAAVDGAATSTSTAPCSTRPAAASRAIAAACCWRDGVALAVADTLKGAHGIAHRLAEGQPRCPRPARGWSPRSTGRAATG